MFVYDYVYVWHKAIHMEVQKANAFYLNAPYNFSTIQSFVFLKSNWTAKKVNLLFRQANLIVDGQWVYNCLVVSLRHEIPSVQVNES